MQCSVENCNRPAASKGMCGMHYHRFCRHGDPIKTVKAYRVPAKCSVDGCDAQPVAKGLCMNHYALKQRNGEPVRTKIFTGTYIKDGYRYVMVGKRHYEPEHRLVMERFLGRKLASNEQVHHKDEDTLNNSPSNLQVVSRSEHLRIHVTKKLTASDVKEIREQYASGNKGRTGLAAEYGVSIGCIQAIISRRNWAHI